MSMNQNYSQSNLRKLHSPLLEGSKDLNDNEKRNSKIKKTYYNPKEDQNNNNQASIDETLDKTLFNQPKLPLLTSDSTRINDKLIDSIETTLKIANVFIIGTGGIFTFLELINILRSVYYGDLSFNNGYVVFIVSFILTVLASVLCQGFIHLIKTTKYIYLNLENQKFQIEKLLDLCKSP